MQGRRHAADTPAQLVALVERIHSEVSGANPRDDKSITLDIGASVGGMLAASPCHEKVSELLGQALAAMREREAPHMEGWLLLYLAMVNHYLGAGTEAYKQFSEALFLARQIACVRLEYVVLRHLGRFLLEEGELLQARKYFAQALQLQRKLRE